MNTQGWIRGLMAKNMEDDKFVRHVADCLSMEFELPVEVIEGYTIRLGQYEIAVTKEEAKNLKNSGAYELDKVLMEKLKEKGFGFDNERSQYVRYCYSIFYKDSKGRLY
ncbi:MAG: hypothetical protein GXZ01_03610 [Clostridiaceae bacterium]|nr:hypothetical protein [Clostridiaceae bacterium]